MFKKKTHSHFDVVTRNADGLISIIKGGRSSQNEPGCMMVAPKKKNSIAGILGPKSEISKGKVSLTLPLRTKSEANCFEHWTIKHKRHKSQQRLVALFLNPQKHIITLPCKILLTRIAPNTLDKHDNLPMSFKYIVDACCAIITRNYASGQADSDDRITIAYDQIKSKQYGIRIDITF